MYYKKYESERIYLSPMNLDDYKIYAKWFNDESVASGIGTFKRYTSEISEKEFIEKICTKGGQHYAIVLKENDELIGAYGLNLKDDISSRYSVGGFIGEEKNRGKGYGTEALKLITKYAFEILNAHSLYAFIYSFNEASLKSAKKAGYKTIGIFRESYYYNGIYHDEHVLEMIKEDYEELKNKN